MDLLGDRHLHDSSSSQDIKVFSSLTYLILLAFNWSVKKVNQEAIFYRECFTYLCISRFGLWSCVSGAGYPRSSLTPIPKMLRSSPIAPVNRYEATEYISGGTRLCLKTPQNPEDYKTTVHLQLKGNLVST
ncbi:hypothetical protein M758_12G178400 [Ceratodon purpureus]|nr:hypothetical protein M758_12G178400 [Ceratodon purpureus]